jgi:hypothetical protein
MPRPRDLISASEIGQWTYCHRAWFLSRAGEVNRNAEALTRGEAAHQRHSRNVARSQTLRWLAFALIFLAFLIFLLAFIAISLF